MQVSKRLVVRKEIPMDNSKDLIVSLDEAMAECLAAKQPVGEYRSDALAAEEILTLANWCLLNYSGLKTPVGSAS